MVVRTFEAEEIVRLPRMTASDTIALTTALVTRAEALPGLPSSITRELGRMRRSLEALRESAETQVQEQGQSDSHEPWNRSLDAAWAALRWWCRGWSLLPHAEHAGQAALARRLEAVLFSDGLRFTQLPFRTQWVESQTHLGVIEKEALGAVITALGGELILSAVRKAHDDFGRALGLTEATGAASTATLRESRDELVDTLRRYVLQVTAHADPDDPASMALADDLLLPIKTWKTRATTPADTGEAAEGATPAVQPAPALPAQPAR
ncbi:MAG TPA: hypothetical protein VNM90_00795 [Haliangium sp.]|nr:hypothetical protein [Haliangium sp.]